MAGPWVLGLAVVRGFQLLILVGVQGAKWKTAAFAEI